MTDSPARGDAARIRETGRYNRLAEFPPRGDERANAEVPP
jgi:hypothetical protein